MSDVKSYKCPSCGGSLWFDHSSNKLKCMFCNKEYDAASFEFEDDKQTEADISIENGIQENLRLFVCDSCGGEIIAEETLGATKCPFCGNNVFLKNTFVNDFKPDMIIPFKINKDEAVNIFNEHLKDKVLLPKNFKELNYIEEIKGVYVPFWIFDSKVEVDYNATGITIRRYSDSSYNYTETNYFDVARQGCVVFDNVPVDGSKAIDNLLMESLEPFDMKDAVSYSPAYLSGYYANRYDVAKDDCIPKAEERMLNTAKDEVNASVSRYSSMQNEHLKCDFLEKNANYVLFPVYLMTVSYKKQTFLCGINGQTGKFVGNLPINLVKYWLIFAAMFILCSAVAALVLFAMLG